MIGKKWISDIKVTNMFLSEMSFLDSVEHVLKIFFHACKVS